MIKKIFALPVIEQISPVLSRRKLDELDLIVVDHPQVKASFALQAIKTVYPSNSSCNFNISKIDCSSSTIKIL